MTASARPVSAAALPSVDLRSGRAARMYLQQWGVNELRVSVTSSSELIKFAYRVVDSQKAAPLNDKKLTPSLLAEKSGERVEVETAERVGHLRQVATPENGRIYWMVFPNRGKRIKRGDRVDITIGYFHAKGLNVE